MALSRDRRACPALTTIHRRYTIRGIVQGVGFRPFVYRLAVKHGIRGTVLNSTAGVIIHAEADREDTLNAFESELLALRPRLARIEVFERADETAIGYDAFEIIESSQTDERRAMVPPDVAMCGECRREILDRSDRHYYYPFTNCTDCGPRFTIVKSLPYDRKMTSMSNFPMCPKCASEYESPGDRRFHAQPVACPECGPQVRLLDPAARPMAEADPIRQAARLIHEGHILAIKGLGGFHLACDALNTGAVFELRRRKYRVHKPFAVMARDVRAARRYCAVSAAEADELESPRAPIVILRQCQAARSSSSKTRETFEALAPGMRTLGVMLPYTPLHLLLLESLFELGCDLLVMTSGNRSGLPLIIDNRSAFEQLAGIADYFLVHNREIINRCDDSVVAVDGANDITLFRRSRGWVPSPIQLPAAQVVKNSSGIVKALGAGGEMKNCFCLLDGQRAFMSQHIGELETEEAEKVYLAAFEGTCRLTGVQPEAVGVDSHPDYRSAEIARRLALERSLPVVAVQHHHAHMAACMADNGLAGRGVPDGSDGPDGSPVIGAILDGTGYGDDGQIWGFEILSGDYGGYERHYHLKYLPLPAGEVGVRHPWMMAVSYLVTYATCAEVLEEWLEALPRMFASYAPAPEDVRTCVQIVKKRLNSPLTSSCGRLFDAVAAASGLFAKSTYDGQAATLLGELVYDRIDDAADKSAWLSGHGLYPFSIEGSEINPGPMWNSILEDLRRGVEPAEVALKFHYTVSEMVARAVWKVAERLGIRRVVLSGGVWQNRWLLRFTAGRLEKMGLEVYRHKSVPPNDGGIALGQAVIAQRQVNVNRG